MKTGKGINTKIETKTVISIKKGKGIKNCPLKANIVIKIKKEI